MAVDHITELIDRLGVRLEYTDQLPPNMLGAYLDDEQRILIRAGLTAVLEEETLHHEYAHAWHRDRSCHPAIEWRAWRFAARLIVDPLKYAAAEQVSESSLSIAQELGTTVKIIEAYRKAIVYGESLVRAA